MKIEVHSEEQVRTIEVDDTDKVIFQCPMFMIDPLTKAVADLSKKQFLVLPKEVSITVIKMSEGGEQGEG